MASAVWQEMSDQEVQRDLGRMEAQISNLCSEVKELTEKVDTISTTLSEAKGGWKFLLAVGGMAGAIGSAITYFFQHFPFAPR
jgi:hypothetical protein